MSTTSSTIYSHLEFATNDITKTMHLSAMSQQRCRMFHEALIIFYQPLLKPRSKSPGLIISPTANTATFSILFRGMIGRGDRGVRTPHQLRSSHVLHF